jgi:hypothetical protein
MNSRADWTNEEQAIIERLTLSWSKAAMFSITMDSLLAWWSGFVDSIERGYPLTIDDYINDLSTRYHLEQLMQSSPGIAEKLGALVERDDRRFLEATEVEDFTGFQSEPPRGWWDHRVPLHPGAELKSDLDKWRNWRESAR